MKTRSIQEQIEFACSLSDSNLLLQVSQRYFCHEMEQSQGAADDESRLDLGVFVK